MRGPCFLSALQRHAPDIYDVSMQSMDNAAVDHAFMRPNKEIFASCRADSIDYAVMEKHHDVVVIPFHGLWSHVGSWNAVAALSPADPHGNRIHGQAHIVESHTTFIHAPYRPVIALGTKDLFIIDTPDAVLVLHKDKSEQVKELVAKLIDEGINQAVIHQKVARPWGTYDCVDTGERHQVKRISVKPGAKLSLQMHQYRAEHWIVV